MELLTLYSQARHGIFPWAGRLELSDVSQSKTMKFRNDKWTITLDLACYRAEKFAFHEQSILNCMSDYISAS